jgi:hypothetical protein
MTRRQISLAAGIMPEATPAQLIEAAAASDFDFGGMWAERETWTPATTRAIRQQARDAGVELLVGGDNGLAPVGIRLGGNEAGISYGMHLNLALIGIEAESHAVNIGINNSRVIERRTSFISYINIASF